MMVFGMSDRGKFRAVEIDASEGRGVQVSIAGGNPVGNSSLVTSFSATQSENYAVSQCLNGGTYLYTFGHDPSRSQFSVGVTSFLRSCKGSDGKDLETALRMYRNGRVSESRSQSTLSVGSGSMSGYLVSQSIDLADQQLGIINTVYTFIALSVH